MEKIKKGLSTRNLLLVWILGLAGQLCWNLENQWFNMYAYKYFDYKIGTVIITYMVIFSAAATCFSTFLFGTMSDRRGSRKIFIALGYITWGIFTFLFGLTHLMKAFLPTWLMITMVVAADTIMSFFGSMGNDSGFNAWMTDLLNDDTKKSLGVAIAVQPVLGTIVGTVLGGMLVASSLGYIGFFGVMGGIVALIGVISIFTVEDSPNLKAKKEGGFWHQFASAFNFKEFVKNKELVLVCITLTVYFIGFNCFFSYIGNIFVFNYGFNEGDFGYLEGIALVIAIALMIFFITRFKKDRSPLLILVAVLTSILGLGLMILTTSIKLYDAQNLLSVKNLLLFVAVVIFGFGYVVFMQTIMTWMKELYPEDKKGQYEGIRILFFVLIPMVFGSLLSKWMIDSFGTYMYHLASDGVTPLNENVPNEALFFASIIIMVLSLIPLYFVSKLHKERMKLKEIEK